MIKIKAPTEERIPVWFFLKNPLVKSAVKVYCAKNGIKMSEFYEQAIIDRLVKFGEVL